MKKNKEIFFFEFIPIILNCLKYLREDIYTYA
jgi:hypothetical protein